VKSTAVRNAANLALFLVNLTSVLLHDARQMDPSCSILDLKAQYRGSSYVRELIKLLPEINTFAKLGR
jgi:putative transposase